MRMAQQRVISLYDIADRTYCSAIIRDESRQAGHVPLIEHNPRKCRVEQSVSVGLTV